ncbi:MAG: hypothetical protein CL693_01635 [Cellvibrionaceae bacterium]|nr:hypothetical protein [Cellvibrionaceae bacterium]|tara:strand:- start:6917 stop:7276 length:360 start_codon:yes stop_codon:yes gene_type:complete
MNKVMSVLLVVFLIISGWMHYDTQRKLLASQQQMLRLNAQLTQMSEQMALVQQELGRVNADGIDGMVKDANDALLSGWESLVNTVEKELKRARENSSDKGQRQKHSEALLESPDGTERI